MVIRGDDCGPGAITPGMDVLDLDGERIGRVAHVHGHGGAHSPEAQPVAHPGAPDAVLEVGTGFFGVGRRLYLPASAVRGVADGCVFVSEPRQFIEAEAWRRGWYDAPQRTPQTPEERPRVA